MVVGEKERETKLMMAPAVPFALAEKSQEEPGEDIAQEPVVSLVSSRFKSRSLHVAMAQGHKHGLDVNYFPCVPFDFTPFHDSNDSSSSQQR